MKRHQDNELGNYAFFRQQGHMPHPDAIDDGSIAMHHDEVLHDHYDSGRADPYAEYTQMSPDVHIVDASMLGRGVKKAKTLDAADLWLLENDK